MSASADLSALSSTRKLLLGGGILLFINSFLPWYHASFMGTSVSANGWHQLGTLAWIVLLVVLIWEAARIAGMTPVEGRQADLASASGVLISVLFGVIFLIQRLSDGSLGIGFWIGLVLLAVVAYAAFQLFTASGGQAALKEVQAQAAAKRAASQSSSTPPASTPPASTPPAATPPADPAPRDPQDPPSTPPPAV